MLGSIPCALVAVLLPQHSQYDVVVLPKLADEFLSVSADLNDCGQMVGHAGRNFSSSSWGYVPWKWSLATGKVQLPAYADHHVAYAINNSGVVVGGSAFENSTPWKWESGVLTDLGTFGNYTTGAAFGLNDLGQIVGTLHGSPDATFWYDPAGGMTDLWPGTTTRTREPPTMRVRWRSPRSTRPIATHRGLGSSCWAFPRACTRPLSAT